MINWGIIGLGNMANKFASSIVAVENANLKAIASNNIHRLNNFGDKFNIDKKCRFHSYDEILNCNEINSVYISTLNNTHADIIIKTIKAKKNILCEKPLTTNYQDAKKVFETLNKSDVFFLEAIAYRTHQQTQFVIKKIKEGEIGLVKKIDATFGFLVKKINFKSRLFDKKLGGGAILDVGCYPVSYSNLIANLNEKKDLHLPELIDVSGSLCETGVDEFSYVTLKFKNGIIARIGAGIRLTMKNNTLIEGTKGKILVHNPWLPDKKTFVDITTSKGNYKSFINSDKNIYANQINVVSQQILEGNKEANFPAMSWKDSLANMRILEQWKNKLDTSYEKKI